MVTSWHAFGARKALEYEIEERGLEAYVFVDGGRQVLWCTDDDCTHKVAHHTFGQVFQDSMTVEQLYRLGQLEYLRRIGKIRMLALWIGSGPASDKSRERNRKVLQEALESQPFEVDVFDGDGHDRDGVIAWTEPIAVTSFAEERDDLEPEVILQPWSASLEIGYTMPSRTWQHLIDDGAVWRWPYGSDRLWLCVHVRETEKGWVDSPMHPAFEEAETAQPAE